MTKWKGWSAERSLGAGGTCPVGQSGAVRDDTRRCAPGSGIVTVRSPRLRRVIEIPTQEAASRLAEIVADVSTDHSRLVLRGDDGAVAVVLSAEEFADLEDLASVADYYLRKDQAERRPV